MYVRLNLSYSEHTLIKLFSSDDLIEFKTGISHNYTIIIWITYISNYQYSTTIIIGVKSIKDQR